MQPTRKPYPSDVSDEEWVFVAPCLSLLPADAVPRRHELREVFNALKGLVRAGAPRRRLQGYAGAEPVADAAAHGLRLVVVKHPGAKRGFMLLPRRRVVERSFAWATRFRRLAKDDERPPQVLAGLHFVAFACLMVHKAVPLLASGPSHALGSRARAGAPG